MEWPGQNTAQISHMNSCSYTCFYIHLHVYIHTCTHIYIHICIYVYVNIYIYIYVYTKYTQKITYVYNTHRSDWVVFLCHPNKYIYIHMLHIHTYVKRYIYIHISTRPRLHRKREREMEHSHQSLTFEKKRETWEIYSNMPKREIWAQREESKKTGRDNKMCSSCSLILFSHLVIQCRFQCWKRQRMLKNVINVPHCATFMAKERKEWKNQILAGDSNQRSIWESTRNMPWKQIGKHREQQIHARDNRMKTNRKWDWQLTRATNVSLCANCNSVSCWKWQLDEAGNRGGLAE